MPEARFCQWCNELVHDDPQLRRYGLMCPGEKANDAQAEEFLVALHQRTLIASQWGDDVACNDALVEKVLGRQSSALQRMANPLRSDVTLEELQDDCNQLLVKERFSQRQRLGSAPVKEQDLRIRPKVKLSVLLADCEERAPEVFSRVRSPKEEFEMPPHLAVPARVGGLASRRSRSFIAGTNVEDAELYL